MSRIDQWFLWFQFIAFVTQGTVENNGFRSGGLCWSVSFGLPEDFSPQTSHLQCLPIFGDREMFSFNAIPPLVEASILSAMMNAQAINQLVVAYWQRNRFMNSQEIKDFRKSIRKALLMDSLHKSISYPLYKEFKNIASSPSICLSQSVEEIVYHLKLIDKEIYTVWRKFHRIMYRVIEAITVSCLRKCRNFQE